MSCMHIGPKSCDSTREKEVLERIWRVTNCPLIQTKTSTATVVFQERICANNALSEHVI